MKKAGSAEAEVKLYAINLSQVIPEEELKLGWLLRVVSNLSKWLWTLYSCINKLLDIGNLWERGVTTNEQAFFFFFLKGTYLNANFFTNWENEGFSCESMCVFVMV